MTDKDRPSTWVTYREGLCESCVAACCCMPVEVVRDDLVRLGWASEDELSPKKLARRLIREKIIRSFRAVSGLFLLEQKSDGSCVFLGADRKCTVYEKRPGVCRGFPAKLGPRVGFCPAKKK